MRSHIYVMLKCADLFDIVGVPAWSSIFMKVDVSPAVSSHPYYLTRNVVSIS